LGFFVDRGLEIEPEILLVQGSGFDPAYMVNGNLSYRFIEPDTQVPFVLAGYGT
jgi:hypothetical protein